MPRTPWLLSARCGLATEVLCSLLARTAGPEETLGCHLLTDLAGGRSGVEDGACLGKTINRSHRRQDQDDGDENNRRNESSTAQTNKHASLRNAVASGRRWSGMRGLPLLGGHINDTRTSARRVDAS